MEKCVTKMNCKQLTKDPNNLIARKTEELIKNDIRPTDMKNKIKINKTVTTQSLTVSLKITRIINFFQLRHIIPNCAVPTYSNEKAFVSYLNAILQSSNHVLNSTADFINKKIRILN